LIALKQAYILREKCYIKHYIILEILIYQALCCINDNNPKEGLELLDNEVLPSLKTILMNNDDNGNDRGDNYNGNNNNCNSHPLIMYANGCIGKALNLIAFLNFKKLNKSKPSVEDEPTNNEKNENDVDSFDGSYSVSGQEMIDKTLKYFHDYPNSPYGGSHPWILELGGWGTGVEGIEDMKIIKKTSNKLENKNRNITLSRNVKKFESRQDLDIEKNLESYFFSVDFIPLPLLGEEEV
jgi:hypothetical protein